MDKVYLQTYSLGQTMMDDYRGSMKKIAEIGYSGVEFAMGYGGLSPKEMRALLDENGLEAISSHVGLDGLEENIKYLSELGVPYIVCPSIPLSTMEEIDFAASEFNRIGKIAKAAGMKLGYHNHTSEFLTLDGKTCEEWLMEKTDPDLVFIELDVGWATAAGVDVPKFLKDHSGRVELIHVKETSKVIGPQKPFNFKDLPKDENGHPILSDEIKEQFHQQQLLDVPTGKGIIDWQQVKTAADANGCKGYIVEREWAYREGDIFGCIAEDLAALRPIQ